MFVEIILSLATVTAFLLFALKPTALTIISLVKEIGEKEATITTLDQKIANLGNARNVYSSNQIALPAIESAVPDDPQPEVLVKQIEAAASKNSVKVLGVSIGEITLVGKETTTKKKSADTKGLPSGSKEMSVSISVSGSYPNITSFAKDVENLRRPIKVDSLGINLSETDEGRFIVALISGRLPFLGTKQ